MLETASGVLGTYSSSIDYCTKGLLVLLDWGSRRNITPGAEGMTDDASAVLGLREDSHVGLPHFNSYFLLYHLFPHFQVPAEDASSVFGSRLNSATDHTTPGDHPGPGDVKIGSLGAP